MQQIMKDMNDLKEKASAERIKAKQDAKLVQIEQERDWFRNEALKLNKICKNQKIILDRLKIQYENVSEDKDYYQAQLFEEKMNSKTLAIENFKFKSGNLQSNSVKSGSQVGIDDGIASHSNLKSSVESVQRMRDNTKNLEES